MTPNNAILNKLNLNVKFNRIYPTYPLTLEISKMIVFGVAWTFCLYILSNSRKNIENLKSLCKDNQLFSLNLGCYFQFIDITLKVHGLNQVTEKTRQCSLLCILMLAIVTILMIFNILMILVTHPITKNWCCSAIS